MLEGWFRDDHLEMIIYSHHFQAVQCRSIGQNQPSIASFGWVGDPLVGNKRVPLPVGGRTLQTKIGTL